jgi:hypothetical protein
MSVWTGGMVVCMIKLAFAMFAVLAVAQQTRVETAGSGDAKPNSDNVPDG